MGRAFKGLFRLLRRNQNLLFVVVAFGATLGLAAASGYWLFYRAAYVIGGLAPICFVWARAPLRPPWRLLRRPHPGLDRRPLRAVPLQPHLRRQPSAAGLPASGEAAALLGPACPAARRGHGPPAHPLCDPERHRHPGLPARR